MSSPEENVAAGSVHGRFQPLHNGHLEYIKAALERSDFLYIGITQYLLRRLTQVDSATAVHRGQPQSNPLTYFERVSIIDTVLRAQGVSSDRYVTVPFPVEEPGVLHEFLPAEVTVFTTTYDDWNREKINALTTHGYRVVNLWSRERKAVVGNQVRALMRDGSQEWKAMVPSAAVPLLEHYDIGGRLRSLEVGALATEEPT